MSEQDDDTIGVWYVEVTQDDRVRFHVDHQSFTLEFIGGDEDITDRAHAEWLAKQLRIALARLAPPPHQSAFGIIDPDYARIFTQARIVAWQYGYACVAHGSFTRDLDLLLVPWADRATPDVDLVVKRIAGVAGLTVNGPPSDKPHGRRAWTLLLLPGFDEVRWVDVSAIAPQPPADAHHDDAAVDQFASMMKSKLARARERGKGGWQDPAWPAEDISRQLREHVDKGDPVDVANYAMFLALRGEPITRPLTADAIREAVEAERARCIKACEEELEHSAQDTHEGRYNEAICDCISAIKRGAA